MIPNNPTQSSLVVLDDIISDEEITRSTVILEMSRLWPEHLDDSLSVAEAASVVEAVAGRDALVEGLSKIRLPEPSQALQDILTLGWRTIATSSVFDTLERSSSDLLVLSSEYDAHRVRSDTRPTRRAHLLKWRGCLRRNATEQKGNLTLTEADLSSAGHFKRMVFQKVVLDGHQGGLLILTNRLSDRSVRHTIRELSREYRQAAGLGEVVVCSTNIPLVASRILANDGIILSETGLADLAEALGGHIERDSQTTKAPEVSLGVQSLGANLGGIPIRQHLGRSSSARRLFGGAPATYDDIEAGLTFRRNLGTTVLEQLSGDDPPVCIALTGVVGVGKTTLARQICLEQLKSGWLVWELHAHEVVDVGGWIAVDQALRNQGVNGLLLVDDCQGELGRLDRLTSRICRGSESPPALRLIITCETSQWVHRNKRNIVRNGQVYRLGQLQRSEHSRLIDLIVRNPDLSALVETDFLRMSRRRQERFIRSRCNADMFVALKYLCSSETLDALVLGEFKHLEPEHQQLYRVVAALEAAGAVVHRQMVLRLFPSRVEDLPSDLDRLDGIVNEYDISAKTGLFGWQTRHEVIARLVASYKYHDQDELWELFKEIISNVNTLYKIEKDTVVQLCNSEFGVRRLRSASRRRELYQLMVENVPRERVPWHRLVREYLDRGHIGAATMALNQAVDAVNWDSPLSRFAVLIELERSQQDEYDEVDRRAILENVWTRALRNVDRYEGDKHQCRALMRVAERIFQVTGSLTEYDTGLERMDEAVRINPDDDFIDHLRWHREQRARLMVSRDEAED